jgi:hypothetical protein
VIIPLVLVLADPIAISMGSLVVFHRTKSGWAEGGKPLDRKEVSWQKAGSKEAPTKHKVEWSEGPPMEHSQIMNFDAGMSESDVYVSGGKFKLSSFKKLNVASPELMKYAREYVGMRRGSQKKVLVEHAVSGDFNGDGKTELFVSVTSGSTSATRKRSDFNGAFLRSSVNGNVKTFNLIWETNFGEQRGPFSTAFLTAGDFDGNGSIEFMISTTDSWGTLVQLFGLPKSGQPKLLCKYGFGE